MTPAVVAARRRHPSTRSPVGARSVADGVAGVLEGRGAEWPLVAATALRVRGRAGCSPAEWACRLGVDVEAVHAAESGAVGVDELPAPLRREVRAALLDGAPRWLVP